MAEIEDNKDKNIEMAETESLGEMEKPTAEDTLTEDKSENDYSTISSTPLQKQLAASGSYQVSPMLTAVPTNSTIPVKSMANPPPPTFMTPIMTTTSVSGALTGLPQQQADSTDRSRKGQRKPKERGNSSSSKLLSGENIPDGKKIPVQGSGRSPQRPKMQIFNGRGSITWEAFICQFERTAGRRQWENRKKVCRLLDSLADVALEQRSPSQGYRANQSATPTMESLNSNGSGQRSTPKSIGHETSPHDKTEQTPTSSSDIVIRRAIGKSLAVRGTIYDQNVSMIVDTAAMITLVNEKLIAADNEDSETVTLRGLGEQLVTGKIIKNTSLDIDRVNIQWDMCKAPLTDDVILGLDILGTLGAVINLSTPTLTINNKVMNAAFVNSGGEISIQQVCIKRTITVPPNSEMTVTIKTNKSVDQEFILDPYPLTSCVLVLHVVGKANSCPLTIDGNRHIRRKKGTPIGYIE
ncbi:unnamed protein product [Mytilus coruscus]|uniref:Retropepsins domain-containing protein n=1 Tax=Mytilus coruscus TaxID=42192 RepID=A0A6J8DH35_MYTCO|nr:unnamed protein product [Mytilus coruscus]